jgi:hypothetical protein
MGSVGTCGFDNVCAQLVPYAACATCQCTGCGDDSSCTNCGSGAGILCNGVPTYCSSVTVDGSKAYSYTTPVITSVLYVTSYDNNYVQPSLTVSYSIEKTSGHPAPEDYYEEAYAITFPSNVTVTLDNTGALTKTVQVYFTGLQPTSAPTVSPTTVPSVPTHSPTTSDTAPPTAPPSPTYAIGKLYSDSSCTDFTSVQSMQTNRCLQLSSSTYNIITCGKL